MSYTYIKTVFPEFEFTNVYNDNLYKNVNETSNNLLNIVGFSQSDINQSNVTDPFIETFKEIDKMETQSKNNLKFYNDKVINQNIPQYNNIETFVDHHDYIDHINNCKECKDILLKQFGYETQRINHDDLMELFSYIIFGILLYMLIKY